MNKLLAFGIAFITYIFGVAALTYFNSGSFIISLFHLGYILLVAGMLEES